MSIRRTKIVCTLGPACDSEETLEKLIKNGLDCARFNFSHGTHQEAKVRLDRFRKVCTKLNVSLPAALDTKGPEIRIGDVEGKVTLKKDQEFTFTIEECKGNDKRVFVNHKKFPNDLKPGNKVLIDDGLIECQVIRTTSKDVICKVINEGTISSHKGVNLPNVKVSLPSLTKQDVEDLRFAAENHMDYVFASFIRTKEDILIIKKFLENFDCPQIRVIAKIENQEGLDNFDDILKESDGVMVARGDLGVEIPFERVCTEQKKMIKKTVEAGKIVITATQMLDSMIKNPRPTRAEVTDVANSILDGTTCIMLSGETASGAYGPEAVDVMAKIALETEKHIERIDLTKSIKDMRKLKLDDIEEKRQCVNYSVAVTSNILKADAILCVSENGRSPLVLSNLRPAAPIYVITKKIETAKALSLAWGIYSVVITDFTNFDEGLSKGIAELKKRQLLKIGDTVILAGGASRLEDTEGKQVVGGILKIH